MSTTKQLEKLIEQTRVELDQVYNWINTFVGTGTCNAPILDKLLDQRNALVRKKKQLEKQLIDVGGTPKPYHLDELPMFIQHFDLISKLLSVM